MSILILLLSVAIGTGGTAMSDQTAIDSADVADLRVVAPMQSINEVSGAAMSDRNIDPGEFTYGDGLRRIRGAHNEMTVDWSMPGLPDTIESVWNSDEYDVPGALGQAKIHAGTFLLRDDIGSWTGPFGGVEYISGATDLQATLVGGAGYTGQCAILNAVYSNEHRWQMDGLVFDCGSMQ